MFERAGELVCPRCGHPLNSHNDAGIFGGGQGQMRCYYNDSVERLGSYRQFFEGGEPFCCGCSYDGPGTMRT